MNGHVALVTGSGGGIGRATARRLAADGAAVVVNDVNADAAVETVATIAADGGRAVAIPGDITDPETVDAIVAQAADELGPVDILVNNVGGAPAGIAWREFRATSIDEFDAFVRLNLGSAFLCTRAVINGMIERRWGKVVCVNSISAVYGQRAESGTRRRRPACRGSCTRSRRRSRRSAST